MDIKIEKVNPITPSSAHIEALIKLGPGPSDIHDQAARSAIRAIIGQIGTNAYLVVAPSNGYVAMALLHIHRTTLSGRIGSIEDLAVIDGDSQAIAEELVKAMRADAKQLGCTKLRPNISPDFHGVLKTMGFRQDTSSFALDI